MRKCSGARQLSVRYNAKVWLGWTFVLGSAEAQVMASQPREQDIMNHLIDPVFGCAIDPCAMFKINFWTSHAEWLLTKRLEYSRASAGEKFGDVLADEAFPNAEMEFDSWQRHIWGSAGQSAEKFAETYRAGRLAAP